MLRPMSPGWLCVSILACLALAPPAMAWPVKTDSNAPQAARRLVERLLPDAAERFAFEVIPPDDGRDVFEIESRGDRVVIRGNAALSMATGLNWYLNHDCHCHVSLQGRQLELPDPLPQVSPKVRRASWAPLATI